MGYTLRGVWGRGWGRKTSRTALHIGKKKCFVWLFLGALPAIRHRDGHYKVSTIVPLLEPVIRHRDRYHRRCLFPNFLPRLWGLAQV